MLQNNSSNKMDRALTEKRNGLNSSETNSRTLIVKREWTDHLLRNVQTVLRHKEEKERDRNRNEWISSSSSGSQGLCFLSAVIK